MTRFGSVTNQPKATLLLALKGHFVQIHHFGMAWVNFWTRLEFLCM